MEKARQLEIAQGTRKEHVKWSRNRNQEWACGASNMTGSRFAGLAEKLENTERAALLKALKASLERERRRCRGRNLAYDPGRHIGLHLAVKALMPEARKPPA